MRTRFLLTSLVAVCLLLGLYRGHLCWAGRVAPSVCGAAAGAVADPSPLVAVGDAPRGATAGPEATLRALRFLPNRGQWDPAVRYRALGSSQAAVHDDGFTVRFERWSAPDSRDSQRFCEGAQVRTRFVGGQAAAIAPSRPLPGRHHFLCGREPTAHVTDVPSFAELRLERLYPGIDLVLRPTEPGGSAFAYDLHLLPGADLRQVVGACEGAAGLRLAADGGLVLSVPLPDGTSVDLRQEPPVSWQQTADGPRPLAVSFRLLGGNRFGFEAPDLDPLLATVVDPGIVWSTLLGGGATDAINGMRHVDGQGIWLGGWAGSLDFPTTPGVFRTTGGRDAFVACVSTNGRTLRWATYLGGSLGDEVRGIAVDASLAVAVVGWTRSVDFPVTAGAYQGSYGGASAAVDIGDAFVARLSANGSTLLGATYLGGGFDDVAEAVAVDAVGNAYVAGWTSSVDFPTTAGAWQRTFGGAPTLQTDGFLAKLAPDARTAAYVTYVGATFPDQLLDIALDAATGQVTAVGWTLSANFPTSISAFRTSSGGGIDGVAVRLNASGSAAVWSTYLGGVGNEQAHAVALAVDGSVWIGGYTESTNFPTTTGAVQRSLAGGSDGFVLQLAGDGRSLLAGTLLGGAGNDAVRDLAVGPGGVLVVGETTGQFPVTSNAIQSQFGGGSLDGFVARLTSGVSQLADATYLGGRDQDMLRCVQFLGSTQAMVGGSTFASDFPVTPSVFQSELRGAQDGVLLQLDFAAALPGYFAPRVVATGGGAFVPGAAIDAMRLAVANRTDRWLTLQRVRVNFVGSAVDAGLLRDAVVQVGGQPASAEVPVPARAGEVTLPLGDLELAPDSEIELLLRLATRDVQAAGSHELVCILAGATAWDVRADGVGGGPAVTVLAPGTQAGPSWFLGLRPGDADGDGRLTVLDLRQLATLLGAAHPADPDGDGQLTQSDLLRAQNLLLARPQLWSPPVSVRRDAWLSLPGAFPAGSVPELTVGGRSATVAAMLPRSVVWRLAADHPVGAQVLRVRLDSRILFEGIVVVD